jgi:hypothetical protein
MCTHTLCFSSECDTLPPTTLEEFQYLDEQSFLMIPSFFDPTDARRRLPTPKNFPKSRRDQGVITGKWRTTVYTSAEVSRFVESVLHRLPLPSDDGQVWAPVSGALITTGSLDQQYHRDSWGRVLLQLLFYMHDCPGLRLLPGRHCQPIQYSHTLNSDAPSAADVRGTLNHHIQALLPQPSQSPNYLLMHISSALRAKLQSKLV